MKNRKILGKILSVAAIDLHSQKQTCELKQRNAEKDHSAPPKINVFHS